MLVSRSLNLRKRTYIFSLFSCDKLSFPSFFISSFSPQNLLFLKLSRSCVFLFPTPFTSIICSTMVSWQRQILLRICPIQSAFLCRIWFRRIFFSSICSRNSLLVTFPVYFTSALIFFMYKSLSTSNINIHILFHWGQCCSSADEGRSAGWKLHLVINFHRHLYTPAMSTVSCQVGAALFPSF